MSNWGRKYPESIESRDTPPLIVTIVVLVVVVTVVVVTLASVAS